MTQKEEMGKENLDEVERWCSKLALALLGRVSQARVCWDGDPTLRAESLGEAPFHPSCPPRLGRSLCAPGRSSGHQCCPLPRGTTRGVVGFPQPRALPQNATFPKKLPTALPLG